MDQAEARAITERILREVSDMTRTRIDWCDYTWNPVWGCLNHCEWCYARRIAKRFGLQMAGRDDFVPIWIERNFRRLLPRESSRIFVNSMSDLAYWEPVWIERVMARIAENPQHLFLFLSKQPWTFKWTPRENTMLGYSVTRQVDYDQLQYRTYGVSFLSFEPLLERVELWNERRSRWIIVGAETGNRRDRVVPELAWLREIYHYCRRREIPLFFKSSLRHLWPADVAFPQEYPTGFPHSPQAASAARR